MKRQPAQHPAAWRRWASNIGLLAGLSLLAAPSAMHVYGTWWEHRQRDLFLAQAAEAPAPGHAAQAGSFAVGAGSPPEADARREQAVKLAARKAPRKSAGPSARAKGASPKATRPMAKALSGARGRTQTGTQAGAGRAWHDALLEIPSIGVEAVVTRPGRNWRWIKGPAYDPESPAPGGPGNAVIAAHRNMWARTFERLPRVRPGDKIAILSQGRRHVYVVQWSRKVRTSDTHVLANTREPCVTLYTCVLPFRATERWVVRGRLVASTAAGAPAPSGSRLASGR